MSDQRKNTGIDITAEDEPDILLDENDAEAAEAAALKERAASMMKAITKTGNFWGYSIKGRQARDIVNTMNTTKTGMFARIPIVCKGDSCPYSESCQLLPYDMAPQGEYCPVETTMVENHLAEYMKDFDIDEMSMADRCLLSEIIGFDVMLERCRGLMAKEGTPVIEILAGIAENGEEIRQPSVSKAWEAYEKISKKRDADYQLMLMTRKDKKKDKEDEEQSSLQTLLSNMEDITVDVSEEAHQESSKKTKAKAK